MNNFEGVVFDYLRADRGVFANTQCLIQINPGGNPDTSGPHWYCDTVVADFRRECVFLCEISYSARLTSLINRLRSWRENWSKICEALRRDSGLPEGWPVRVWLFVPEAHGPLIVSELVRLDFNGPQGFAPLITTLEMTQPWAYTSWDRVGEKEKPDFIPLEMRH